MSKQPDPNLAAVPRSPVEREPSLTRELERVEEANLKFYEAFTEGNIELMTQVWADSPHARCIHPGWELVIGWAEIRQSWAEIFQTVNDISFQLQDIHAEVAGRTAWVNLTAFVAVTTDENDAFQAAVNVTNIFEREEGEWKLILHHSTNFADEDESEEEGESEEGATSFGFGYAGGGFSKPN